MKLCENCHISEILPIPQKELKSTPVIMANSPSGTTTFFFPTEEGKLCYFCQKKITGRFGGNPEEYSITEYKGKGTK